MRSLFLYILLVLAASSGATTACASTWRVERDGSGDFADIQPAVAAAAPGDTILIGPGRYEAMTEWDFDGLWTLDVLVGVRVDSLTIIGASRDEVILGPEVAGSVDPGPKGIVVEPSVSMIRVENLRVENVNDGFYAASGGVLADCTISGCSNGASLFESVGMTIKSCRFESGDFGVVAFDGTEALVIEDCFVEVESVGFRFLGVLSSTLRRASVQGGVVGILADGSSGLAIYDSTIEGCDQYSLIMRFTFAEIYDSVFGATGTTVSTIDGGELRGAGCVFGSGQGEAMRLAADTNVDLSGCNILPSASWGFAVAVVESAPSGAYQQRITDCYWGLADSDSVAGVIWDAVDQPSIGTIVEYLPISATSVKTESVPLGSVKSMFR
jgi:hypothetical protein